jgi:organic hydroperoxide reductase OsmC/OhrA
MARLHSYMTTVTWTGNLGSGTSGYRDYQRAHSISSAGKEPIAGSSDPTFRGDRTRWNPEELLVASLSACHQLWYLHLCADAGVVVMTYIDEASGTMEESGDGDGEFVEVTLRPRVGIAAGSDAQKAHALHEEAHAHCFIARSIHFPILCEPVIEWAS